MIKIGVRVESMKRIKTIPIRLYIQIILNEPSIAAIMEGWSVEYEAITEAITTYLERKGIFEVDPVQHKKIIMDTVKSQLFQNQTIKARKIELYKMEEETSARKRKQAGA